MSFEYDLLVIGAGPGGLAASERAAQYGAHVAIAEQNQVGGTCVVHGCVPEKMLTYASRFSRAFQNADEYGWSQVSSRFHWLPFREARNQNISHLSQVHTGHLQEAGVKVLYGQAQFLDPHTLEIADRAVTADKILIAVGATGDKPMIPGAEHTISIQEMFQLPQQPKTIAIAGNNYFATKSAGILNGLGSQVTQIISEAEILPNYDQDLRSTIQEGMRRLGIKILSQTQIQAIEPGPEGLNLTLNRLNDQSQTELTVETVVYAAAYTPNISHLHLEQIQVEATPDGIVVDDYSRTTQPHIFAVGDCTPRPHWTPAAIAAGRAFADTEFGHTPRTVNYHQIPFVVATQPEAATIGLTEAQAQEQFGSATRCYVKKFQPLFNLIGECNQEVLLKLVVDGDSERIVGAHMVGECASEVIQMLAPAMKAGVTKQDFDQSLGIHPSISEEFFTL